MDILKNGLYIISTPIGNLEDISLRAQKTLSMVDYIICENPIHSLKLLNKLGIKKRLFSLHDYNENILIKRIEKYQHNSSIALISDAGSPLISDPGHNLVNDYIKKNIYITTVPGPSSIISALQLSGIPISNFRFFGFIPKNKANVNKLVNEIENLTSTSVFFVSGNRLINFLKNILEKKIIRTTTVCKEITKKNERVFRGSTKNIINEILMNKNNIKGEFVVIIEGKEKKSIKKVDVVIEKQMMKLLKKFSLTDVVEIVHKLTKISKNKVYKWVLKIKKS